MVHSEIRELNRMICNRCDEKEYEKCKACKIYLLVNKEEFSLHVIDFVGHFVEYSGEWMIRFFCSEDSAAFCF